MTDINKVAAALNAAMLSPESDIAEPTRRRSSSFSSQVQDLEVGEIASRVEPISWTNLPSGTTLNQLTADVKQRLRNAVAPAVSKIKARNPGSEYSVEVCDLLTPGSTLVVIALVTREA